jgi:hypothetical protein
MLVGAERSGAMKGVNGVGGRSLGTAGKEG